MKREKNIKSCRFPVAREGISNIVQGDFYKIIDTDRSELCFLSVSMVNAG